MAESVKLTVNRRGLGRVWLRSKISYRRTIISNNSGQIKNGQKRGTVGAGALGGAAGHGVVRLRPGVPWTSLPQATLGACTMLRPIGASRLAKGREA